MAAKVKETKLKKLRTRGHRVVLNRSAGGDGGIAFMLIILGAFMFLPMYYVVIQSLKPLDELFMFPLVSMLSTLLLITSKTL